MKPLFVLGLMLSAPTAMAEINFATSCVIIDGDADGYVHNQGHSFWIEGRPLYHFYNANGEFIKTLTSTSSVFHHASSGRREKVDDANAPSDAVFCAFDLSECDIYE